MIMNETNYMSFFFYLVAYRIGIMLPGDEIYLSLNKRNKLCHFWAEFFNEMYLK